MQHGSVSFPPSPMQMIKQCWVTFKCWRCGKIGQQLLKPQDVIDDHYIAICVNCAFKLTPTNMVVWFREEWTRITLSGCDPVWSYQKEDG